MGTHLMPRGQDWPEKLAEAIEQAKTLPFEWGYHDCALWCANAILAMTGVDYAQDLRNQYQNEVGAKARLLQLGFPSLESKLDSHFPPVAVPFARRGDVVMHRNGAVGICDGVISWFVTPDGLARVKPGLLTKAWAVE